MRGIRSAVLVAVLFTVLWVASVDAGRRKKKASKAKTAAEEDDDTTLRAKQQPAKAASNADIDIEEINKECDTTKYMRKIQDNIRVMENELHDSIEALKKEHREKKQALIDERNTHAPKAKDFFVRSLFGHMDVSSTLFGIDPDVLEKVEDLTVKLDDVHNDRQYNVTMILKPNPYISNRVLWRYVTNPHFEEGSYKVSGVDWIGPKRSPSFFNFFEMFDKDRHRIQHLTQIGWFLSHDFIDNPFQQYNGLAVERMRRRNEEPKKDLKKVAEESARVKAQLAEDEVSDEM